jgi:predicted RNA-binding Zn-ribbon protein involved in translation (DUF1610 family)/predicted heme/steroid binding protein
MQGTMSEENTFAPQGYVPTRSALDGITVYMPAPQIETLEETVSFACPNCGGKTAYNVREGGLSCTTCGYYQEPEGKRVGRRAEAQEFRTERSVQEKEERIRRSLGQAPPATAAAAAVGTEAAEEDPFSFEDEPTGAPGVGLDQPDANYDWGEDRQQLECGNCGAEILLAPKALTHTCPFCGSSQVVQTQFKNDKMRPRYLIPFKVEVQQAKSIILEWLDSSWMTPGDLKQRAGLDELTGIYLPYWSFSATCSADWKAQVGHTRYYTDSKGNRRSRTVWKWESGRVHEPIQNLLVPGTNKLNVHLLEEITQFNLADLVEYDPAFIAGFNAQTYDVELDSAWGEGRRRMGEMTKRACKKQASTNKIRNFSMNMDFDDETWRYVLLPVYLTTYRYEDETFQVKVNGQMGEITGQRPVDWRKVIAACAASIVPSILIALGALIFGPRVGGEDGLNLLMVAGVAFVIGLLASGYLVWSALQVRKSESFTNLVGGDMQNQFSEFSDMMNMNIRIG